MIELNNQDNLRQVILSPNRSMSWKNNKRILLAIFFVNITIAIAWSAMGAWMVLPFAGLEVLCVGIGMYYVSWKLSFKQIVNIEADSLILQTGVYFPKQEWQWPLSSTCLIIKPSHYRMSAPQFFLSYLNNKIEIGEFLNRKEKKQLKIILHDLGIHSSQKKQAI